MILLLLSPGIPMLSAGQDFLRSKKGKRNTYQDGEINALDYRKLEKYKHIHDEINAVIKFKNFTRGESLLVLRLLVKSRTLLTS